MVVGCEWSFMSGMENNSPPDKAESEREFHSRLANGQRHVVYVQRRFDLAGGGIAMAVTGTVWGVVGLLSFVYGYFPVVAGLVIALGGMVLMTLGVVLVGLSTRTSSIVLSPPDDVSV